MTGSGISQPKRLLLATDLSPRSDRALDRAAALAKELSAELFVVHVLEENRWDEEEDETWRRAPDRLEGVRRQLLRDVGAVTQKATILIEEGDPAEAILRTTEREQCDLIVTGVARDELLGRFRLGKSVEKILRTATVPVLVAKNRVHRRYNGIVVATDFSEGSRQALHAATACFPGRRFTIFHADADTSAASEAQRRQREEALRRDCTDFVGTVLPDWETRIEFGAPDNLLRQHAEEQRMDLVVLGTHGRSAVIEFFLGSVAKRILAGVPCDAFVVRGVTTESKD